MATNESTFSKAPMFDGVNYSFWTRRMETYLSSLDCDVWMSVVNVYIVPNYPPTDPDAKREYENNSKAKNVILSGLSDNEFVKFMHFSSAKETWDKLHKIFEGNAKVKEAKLQTLRA
ncbi:hypothetical protein SUGI_0042290 [Cryptomeria japonica]|nr:hypothetical protein SUGI_0042290 [Cryptomeria japonica]